ncbi:Clp protease ClpP [Peptoniphilus sp. AGMB00490]|uniref:Clp protease ClpP n=1 Tax=Peptoniphilus faecalis TaxID=2731255 RepID=A0A848R875_9FIRM|nr:head maturation protease, ClpP-related [Peptoniphilus faecalis]NMW85487.1 Clp protease ClpP [Peptoniphilus faecalis]
MIKVKNEADKTTIFVSGDIVDDVWRGWSWGDEVETYPQDIRDLLKGAKKNVEVIISSGGGDLFAGMAISNMLQRHEGHTKAIIDGLAASAASIIAFGCDEIEMPSNAYLMIHKPSIGIFGNSDDLLKWADTLDEIQKGLVETYMSKAVEGKTSEDINDLIDKETWLTAKSASEIFNIQVTNPSTVKNDFGKSVLNYKHTPKELINKTDDAEEERKLKEIEIAMAMN